MNRKADMTRLRESRLCHQNFSAVLQKFFRRISWQAVIPFYRRDKQSGTA
jgi:hypothetical protein